jgi:hypothetical protein
MQLSLTHDMMGDATVAASPVESVRFHQSTECSLTGSAADKYPAIRNILSIVGY